MGTATFDTLGYFEKLKAAGVAEEQAKVQADALREIVEDKIATKRDLRDVETALRRDMQEMEMRLRYDLTIRLGGIVVACTVILLAILPLVLNR